MESILFHENVIFIVSDITASVFLVVMIAFLTLQSVKLKGHAHLVAACLLLLNGIFIRIFAEELEYFVEDIGQNIGSTGLSHITQISVWCVSFVISSLGISESMSYVLYVNGDDIKGTRKSRIIANGIIIAAGMILSISLNDIRVYTIAILAQFAFNIARLHIGCSIRALREFVRASGFAITTFLLALAYDPVRLTGLGLSIMIMVLNEQYYVHIGQELEEKEAALKKGRIQLLAEQISPHYIYNSLQSISSLCSTDPVRAGEALEVFSDYLRGNLESLTKEELIPFTRELEYTRAYLELERIAGRNIEVEYSLKAADFMLPPLVLQPIVENAVQHGAGNRTEKTLITIATRDMEGIVCIKVTDRPARMDAGSLTAVKEKDDGVGSLQSDRVSEAHKSATNTKNKKSIGLDNVRARLDIQCGGTLKIHTTGETTEATMLIPEAQHIV